MKAYFPLKNEFKEYCKDKYKSIDSYCAYINQGILQCKTKINIFQQIQNCIDNNDIETINEYISTLENYFITKKSENKIWGDRVSGIRKYLEFLDFYVNSKVEKIIINSTKENPIELDVDYLENNEALEFEDDEFKDSIKLSSTQIRENFQLRLSTQNRFPKEGIFYPIGFIKQIFYKRGQSKIYNRFISNQIDNILINIENDKQIKFTEFSNLLINENCVTISKKQIYSYNSESKKFEKLKIKNFKEIEIDHSKSMKFLLKENAKDLKILKQISNEIRKGLRKSLSYKKLRKRATEISNTDFINQINLDELLNEMNLLNASSQLVLMHRKHNNKKRAK